MIVSLNEIETLAQKAARGAGLSWGLAEEAGAAAAWLAGHQLPWAGSLVALLASAERAAEPYIANGHLRPAAPESVLSPLIAGALISDLGPGLGRQLVVGPVAHPIWLAPFVARAVRGEASDGELRWEGVSVRLGAGGVGVDGEVSGLLAPASTEVTIVIGDSGDTAAGGVVGRAGNAGLKRPPAGYPVSVADWQALESLAHRTYVPATAHSRLQGAGAGLSDND